MRHAQTASQRADQSLRPLIVVILLHRFDMNRCRDLWPRIKLAHQGVLLSLRKLSHISKALEELVCDNAHSQLAKKKFGEMLVQTNAQSYVCRAIVEPIKHLEIVSTHHANKLNDLWDADVFELDPNQVTQLVHGLAAWRDQAEGSLRDIRNFIVGKWQQMGLHEYADVPNEINFRFGSPGGALFTSNVKELLQQDTLTGVPHSPAPATTLQSGLNSNPDSPILPTHDNERSFDRSPTPATSPSCSRRDSSRSPTPRPSRSVSPLRSQPAPTQPQTRSPQPSTNPERISSEGIQVSAGTDDKELPASPITTGNPIAMESESAAGNMETTNASKPLEEEDLAQAQRVPKPSSQVNPRRSTRIRATLDGGEESQPAELSERLEPDEPASGLRRSGRGRRRETLNVMGEVQTMVQTRGKRKSQLESTGANTAAKRRKGKK